MSVAAEPLPARSKWPSARVVTVLAALLVWAYGAIAYVRVQVDDAYIVFAYASEFVQRGELAWSSGERVEGFSSWAHLVACVVGAASGWDLSVATRGWSILATILAGAAMLRPRAGPGGEWVVLALASWQAVQFWSIQQLETMGGAALAAWLWPVVVGRRHWSAGVAGATLLALVRPEGHAWLLVAVASRGRRPLERSDAAGLAALILLVGFHAVRFFYFGHLFPTPFLVKLQTAPGFAAGLSTAGLGVASAAGVITLLFFLRRDIPWMSWVPLAIQSLILVRAGGDWMGNGRFLLPGVFALCGAALVHGRPRPKGRGLVVVGLLCLGGFVWEPDPMGIPGSALRFTTPLLHPIRALASPLYFPLAEDVRFIVEHAPENSVVEMSDVGTPGNVPGVRILDLTGLTSRVIAEYQRNLRRPKPAALRDLRSPGSPVSCVRYQDAGPEGAEDPALVDQFPARWQLDGSTVYTWRCRNRDEVPLDLQSARWETMYRRYPSQPYLLRRTVRIRLALGHLEAALDLLNAAPIEPGYLVWDVEGNAYDPLRGWPVVSAGTVSTPVLPAIFWAGVYLRLDADDPGPEGAAVRLGRRTADGLVSTELRIFGPTEIPVADIDRPTGLEVDFLNDVYEAGVRDRNLWVQLHR